MPINEVEQRLEKVVRERNKLDAEVQRIEGKKEAAEAQLEQVKAACLEKGIEPHQIDQAIAKIEKKYEEVVSGLEADLGKAKKALAPYLGEEE